MNVCLFGPPGIGKSEWIKRLKKQNISSFDFESIWHDQKVVKRYVSMMRLSGTNPSTVYAMAGLDPKDEYNCKKVLLDLPQNAYEQRRSARDALIREKANQEAHKVSVWRTLTKWDRILPATDDGFRTLRNWFKSSIPSGETKLHDQLGSC
jgi:hypothetical protein